MDIFDFYSQLEDASNSLFLPIIEFLVNTSNILFGTFKAVYNFIPFMIDLLTQFAAVIIMILPIILEILVFALTHFYLIFVIWECFILANVYMAKSFKKKLKTFFYGHILMITTLIYIVRTLIESMRHINSIMGGARETIRQIWDYLSSIAGWVFDLVSSNIVTAVGAGILLMGGIIATLAIFASFM